MSLPLVFSPLTLLVLLVVTSLAAVAPNVHIGLDGVLAVYPVVGTNHLGPGTYVYASAGGSKLRVSTASASITRANLDTGSDTTETTRNWAHSQGLSTDDAGHILANRLGGSGKDPVNIFPQNPTINRGTYRVFEGKIADCLSSTTTKITATLTWSFSYGASTDTRPTGVHYCASYSAQTAACQNACQQFSN